MNLEVGSPPDVPRIQPTSVLDSIFQYRERGSTFWTEVLGGLATFSTLSYVLIVHPLILSEAGMDRGALITVTALAAAIFTVVMGLRTNYPLAMAPGMGVNAYVAVQVCQGMHIPWQAAIGMVFYSGLLFLLVSVTGIRRKLIESFPASFKKTVGAGIGLFIAFIGLKNAGIIVANPHSIAALGNFGSARVLLGFAGIVVTVIMVNRGVRGALIVSIALITTAGMFLPGITPGAKLTPLPHQIFDWPHSIAPLFLKLDLSYPLHHPGQCIPIVLALLFSDLFSAMAVLMAIGTRAHLNDENGDLPKLREALSADAAAASGGALLGTTTTVIYLESAAGVAQGARTGLTSIVVALCFLAALFLNPLLAIVPAVATTPALVMIGIFMMEGFADLDLRDGIVAATALVTVMLTLLASVSDGLALGFVTNILLLAALGRARQVKPLAYVLAGILLLHYIF
ncbi:MAG TPA: NCS2 family permease [Terriglobales bacterium]|jgi:AGZA family xanthine/uracil permease-like MFS transporter|nr:NCS2 family permease [Terriglobales bacterium]